MDSPALTLYMRTVENDVENDYEGGRLVMKPWRAGIDPAILDAFLTVSALTDEFLRRFPVTRAEKQGRFFRVTVEEVPYEALPPATGGDDAAQ